MISLKKKNNRQSTIDVRERLLPESDSIHGRFLVICLSAMSQVLFFTFFFECHSQTYISQTLYILFIVLWCFLHGLSCPETCLLDLLQKLKEGRSVPQDFHYVSFITSFSFTAARRFEEVQYPVSQCSF